MFKDHKSAKDIITHVEENNGRLPEGISVEKFWDAKYIYDSAYHPSTGELVFLPGRMSFQGKYLKIYYVFNN